MYDTVLKSEFILYGDGMSATDKLSTLNQRVDDLKRELTDLAAVRPHSENAALVDLETALTRELENVEGQVRQLQTYLDRCASGATVSEQG